MAVYTTLTEREISVLLSRYELPGLLSFEGSSSGIENTTYFLTLKSGDQYVLTVFEKTRDESLLSYIELITQLNHHGLPVPCPCTDKNGTALQIIAQKPALLFVRSRGRHAETTDPIICTKVGSVLGRIHNTAKGLSYLHIPNPCGLDWMRETFAFVKESLSFSDQKILNEQILLFEDIQKRQLPNGLIHGDLFRDNVLFESGSIMAVIDFYNAGQDILLFDLAIVANDWCYSQGLNNLTNEKLNALIMSYQQQRLFSEIEKTSWKDCLQVAATRFWLSRQKRVLEVRRGSIGLVKDPEEYKKLLLLHLGNQ